MCVSHLVGDRAGERPVADDFYKCRIDGGRGGDADGGGALRHRKRGQLSLALRGEVGVNECLRLGLGLRGGQPWGGGDVERCRVDGRGQLIFGDQELADVDCHARKRDEYHKKAGGEIGRHPAFIRANLSKSV